MTEVLRWTHIITGMLGLVLFWIPVFARKGSPLHRIAGRGFLWCTYIVSVSAVTVLALRLSEPISRGVDVTTLKLFPFFVMLVYLAIMLVIGAWYSRHVLQHKADLAGLRKPLGWALAIVSILASVVLVIIALNGNPALRVLLLALSPLGILGGVGMIRHFLVPTREPKAWMIQHLNNALGLGIGYHTAFFVFGMRSFTEQWLTGFWGILPWVLPALIGIPMISWVTRRYRNRFQVANAPSLSTLSIREPAMETAGEYPYTENR